MEACTCCRLTGYVLLHRFNYKEHRFVAMCSVTNHGTSGISHIVSEASLQYRYETNNRRSVHKYVFLLVVLVFIGVTT